MKKGPHTYLLTGIDRDVWRSIKILAAKRDITIKELIHAAIQSYLDHELIDEED